MSGNWQHKILDFDIPPPPEVWSRIANQLDEEYHFDEITIAQKLSDFEMPPPAFMLEKVLDNLEPDNLPTRKAKIIFLPSRRAAIAALVVGLVAIMLIYFVRPRSSSETQQSAATIVPSLPHSNSGNLSLPEVDNIPRQNSAEETEPSSSNIVGSRKSEQASNASRDSRNIKHASLGLLSANAISPISVSAPPIYDGDGNIIMDEDLVSAPDENYIIVTSPSGEQTKISRKFLKMLCVMNGGTDDYYMNAENFEWKLRFEEWRSKLLQQASYIPTANNFLDIMDLKELLQEN